MEAGWKQELIVPKKVEGCLQEMFGSYNILKTNKIPLFRNLGFLFALFQNHQFRFEAFGGIQLFLTAEECL
jgi:hypothetical protein